MLVLRSLWKFLIPPLSFYQFSTAHTVNVNEKEEFLMMMNSVYSFMSYTITP